MVKGLAIYCKQIHYSRTTNCKHGVTVTYYKLKTFNKLLRCDKDLTKLKTNALSRPYMLAIPVPLPLTDMHTIKI